MASAEVTLPDPSSKAGSLLHDGAEADVVEVGVDTAWLDVFLPLDPKKIPIGGS